MARVSGSLPNLINGVSQQPAALRLPTQAELQRNCYSTVVKGLQKRPPTEFVSKITASPPSNAKVHIINRDAAEQYVAVLGDDASLRIYDFNGVEQTVSADPASYTSLNTVSAAVAGTSAQVYQVMSGAVDFTVTITGTATVVLERSATGAFAGEQVIEATRTTSGTTNLTSKPRGHYWRARVSSYTSGAISAAFGWQYFNYLKVTDPETQLKLLTVADYTFVANTTVVTAMGSTTSTVRNPEALYTIKGSNYAVTYTLYVYDSGGTTYYYQFTLPDGSLSAHATVVTTDYIANILYTLMTTGAAAPTYGTAAAPVGALPGAYTVGLNKSSIYVTKSGGGFTADIADGRQGNFATVIKETTQRFSDLPFQGWTNFEIEISGDSSAVADNYYVRCENYATGVWKETVKQGIIVDFDDTKMPWTIVSSGGGVFTLTRPAWVDRAAGDDDTNGAPSFIGKTINDIFFYKNRLGFLSDENIIMSAAADFFRFWKKTATALLDDDPIDLAAAHTKVSILKNAIPYNEQLMLFSDQTQFKLTAGDLLTPKTASITQTTEFESSTDVRPVGAGTFVYFVVEKGEYSSVREYYIKDNSDDTDARDVASHVPQYIPAGIRNLASSTNEDCLVLWSQNDPTKLWVYKYFWSGNEKLQSSWSQWDFPGVTKICGFQFIQSMLYVAVERADGLFLERINFEQGVTGDDALGFRVHVDRKVKLSHSTVSAAYNAGTDRTTFTFTKHDWTDDDVRVIISSGGAEDPGWEVPQVTTPGTTIVVSGDLTAENIIFGVPYTSQYDFSTIHLRKEAPGGGVSVVQEGRLVIQNMSIQFAETAYFRVEVTPRGRPTYTYTFNGALLEEATTVVGSLSIGDGKFQFPVRSKNDRVDVSVINDTPWPMNLISLDWVGMYVQKSQRVS